MKRLKSIHDLTKEYIEALPKKIDERGCWNYLGGNRSYGYGRKRIATAHFTVHRLSAIAFLNLPLYSPGVEVCHTCDNKICFNPEHLYLGTNKTNAADAKERKTHPSYRQTECAYGHSLNRVYKGKRYCNTCHVKRHRKNYDKLHPELTLPGPL